MFYTYLWLREDGTPYYVGKGKHKRQERYLRKGSPPNERIILQDFSSEEEAFFAEMFLISYYGRVDLGTGCLRNLTDGGEGQSGRASTQTLDILGQTFGRLSVLKKLPISGTDPHSVWLCRCSCGVEKYVQGRHLVSGRIKSCSCKKKETCERISKANKGRKFTEEHKRKLSLAKKGKPCSEKLKEILRGRKNPHTVSEEQRESIRKTLTGRKDSEETKKKKSVAQKLRRMRDAESRLDK